MSAVAPAAAAARNLTRFEGIRDCERVGALQFMRLDPAFRRFVIDRATVRAGRYAGYVGNRFVSTIYHGRALYEAAAGPHNGRFICLHGGVGRRALFVYKLPE